MIRTLWNSKVAASAITLLVLLSAPALAETEHVVLRDGVSGMATILDTTWDSLTVKFVSKAGATVETKVMASTIDPVNFYNIRRRYMEETAENCVRLAIFCVENGLFNRAKHQMEMADAIDPEFVAGLKEKPDVLEKIAEYLLKAARKHEEDGNPALAHQVASVVVTRLADTKAADGARSWLAELDQASQAQKAAEEEKRQQKIETEQAADEKAKLQGQEKVLKPIRSALDQAGKADSAGLQAKGSKALSAFNAALSAYQNARSGAQKELKKVAGDEALKGELEGLEAQAKSGYVDSCINAGNVELGRGNTSGAETYARKALGVDPDSSRAQSFLNTVQTAGQDKFYRDEIRSRRPRTGGGRGGRGGR